MDVNLRQRNSHVGTRSALVRSDDTRMSLTDEIHEHTHRTKHHGRTAPCRCRTNSSGSPPTYDTRELIFASDQSVALLDKHRNLRCHIHRHEDTEDKPHSHDWLVCVRWTDASILNKVLPLNEWIRPEGA